MSAAATQDDRAYGSAAWMPPSKERPADAAVHPRVERLLEFKWAVLAFWLIAGAVSLPFAPEVFERTQITISPPKGSEIHRAVERMDREFPGVSSQRPIMAMVSCTSPCDSVLGPFAAEAAQRFAGLFRQLNTSAPGMIVSWDAADLAVRLDGYAAASGGNASLSLQETRVTSDRQHMLYLATWEMPESQQSTSLRFVSRVEALVDELNKKGAASGHEVLLQGWPVVLASFLRVTQLELCLKDALVLPLALGVFVYQVQSWRLALIPGLCILVSLATAYASLVPCIHEGLHLNAVAPPVMAVACMGLSVDYGIFIVSRFREELQRGLRLEAALAAALVHSGSVVALSGSVLVACYGCCLLFSGEMVFTTALGTLWILVISVLSSLTLTPCAIAAVPGFFVKGLATGDRSVSITARAWLRMGVWLTKWPCPVVVPLLIYLCMAPVTWQLTKLHTNSDLRAEIPGGPVMQSYVQIREAFPSGAMDPIYVHMLAKQSVQSDVFFEDTCAVLRNLVNATHDTSFSIQPGDIQSIVTVPSLLAQQLPSSCPELVCLRWSRSPPECPMLPSAQAMLNGADLGPFAGFAGAYQELWASLVSGSAGSSLAVLLPSNAPGDGHMKPFVTALRGVLPPESVYSLGILEYDLQTEDYSMLPVVLTLNVCILFVFIGFTFQSAFAPLKLFLTVVLPIGFVYGSWVLVYGLGVLDSLHLSHANSAFGMNWVVPLVTLTILIGLAIDYDVFLFSRIYELRQQGYDNRAAVVGGLALSGPLISGAGVVMALAFGGLILSSIRLNCEIGFILCYGVLLDTFVIRPLLVPCVLMLGSDLNYWPVKMPEASRSLDDLEERLFQDDAGRWEGAAERLLPRSAAP